MLGESGCYLSFFVIVSSLPAEVLPAGPGHSVDCGSSDSVMSRASWYHFVVLGMPGASGLPAVPAGAALGGGRSASGWGGILCGGRPCLWGMQSVSWAARRAEVALLDSPGAR